MDQVQRVRRAAAGTFLAGGVLLLVCGCDASPPRVALPPFDAKAAARQAMSLYDRDNNGELAGEELTAAAALNSALSFYDPNGDKRVTTDELAARLQQLLDSKIGLLTFTCRVTRAGQPLVGATVTLRPEAYLATTLLPATGVTDAKGNAQLAIADVLLPETEWGLNAVRPGLYRVEITHPTIPLAEQFNRSTMLGQEIAGDSLVGRDIVFAVD